jgi:5-methylcytosine-specific restriction endonuclease McrA
MSRSEFSKPTKRDALKRSGGLCEAIGSLYGLQPTQRCNGPLAYGVEFDHVILDANSKDNSLENCAAVCVKCHKFKTTKHDTPLAAKTVRQRDKNDGIKSRSTFRKPPPNSHWDWKLGRRVFAKDHP